MTGQRGFTLIEILVAISLLALLGVLGYRGLDATTRTAGRLTEQAGRWQEIDLALARLGSDVRQAVSLAGHDNGWHQQHRPPELTLNSIGDGGAALRRTTYRWRDGQLELQTWPAIDASAPGRSHLLLSGVSALELASLDRDQRWLDSWPPASRHGLPRALRVRLTLAEGGMIERIFDVAAAD